MDNIEFNVNTKKVLSLRQNDFNLIIDLRNGTRFFCKVLNQGCIESLKQNVVCGRTREERRPKEI